MEFQIKSLLSFKGTDFSPLVIQKNDYGTDLFNGDDGVVAGEKAFLKMVKECEK